MGFVQRLPRRALIAAMLGAAYGILWLPLTPRIPLIDVGAPGVAWFALSLALLFRTALAYYTFTAWTLLWVVWKAMEYAQDYQGALPVLLDVGVPAAAFLLLLTSGYLEAASEGR